LRLNTIHPEKKRSSLFVSLEKEMDMRKDTEKCARRERRKRNTASNWPIKCAVKEKEEEKTSCLNGVLGLMPLNK
jgi:HSP20 family molecular chaperone IbpA